MQLNRSIVFAFFCGVVFTGVFNTLLFTKLNSKNSLVSIAEVHLANETRSEPIFAFAATGTDKLVTRPENGIENQLTAKTHTCDTHVYPEDVTQLRLLFLSDKKAYQKIMDPFYDILLEDARKSPFLKYYDHWGPGWTGFDNDVGIIENLKQRYSSEYAFDIALGFGVPDEYIKALNKLGVVTVMRKHECRKGEKCDKIIGSYRMAMLVNPFEVVENSDLELISRTKLLIHVPSPASLKYFTPVEAKRPIDVSLLGAVNQYYPARMKWKKVLTILKKKYKLVVKVQATGNYFSSRQNNEQKRKSYMDIIKKSKITLTGASKVFYSLQKFAEMAAGGALILSNIPHDRGMMFRRFIVESPMNQTPEQLASFVMSWIENSKKRKARVLLGQQWWREEATPNAFFGAMASGYDDVIKRNQVGKKLMHPFIISCRKKGGEKYCPTTGWPKMKRVDSKQGVVTVIAGKAETQESRKEIVIMGDGPRERKEENMLGVEDATLNSAGVPNQQPSNPNVYPSYFRFAPNPEPACPVHRVPSNRVAFIIVNYNMVERTDQIVENIRKKTKWDVDYFVVDNGSDLVKPSRYTTIRIEKNVQTTNGWLVGLQYARSMAAAKGICYFAYWIWITTCAYDTTQGDILSPLAKFLIDNPKAAAIAPALTPSSTTGWGHLKKKSDTDKPRPVKFVDELGVLWRASFFDSILQYDPDELRGFGIDIETSYLARYCGRTVNIHDGVTVIKKSGIAYKMKRMNANAGKRGALAIKEMQSLLRRRYTKEYYPALRTESKPLADGYYTNRLGAWFDDYTKYPKYVNDTTETFFVDTLKKL